MSLTTPKNWPHASVHSFGGSGTFMVTAATLNKRLLFLGSENLNLLESKLLSLAQAYQWNLRAWAVFANHYHFVGRNQIESDNLSLFLKHLDADTARELNRREGRLGREVWFNFWDTKLTYERSYFARLNYVHQNPVKHGLVRVANQYPWCSASWFERSASPALIKTIYSFKTDTINVYDDF